MQRLDINQTCFHWLTTVIRASTSLKPACLPQAEGQVLTCQGWPAGLVNLPDFSYRVSEVEVQGVMSDILDRIHNSQ